MPNATSVWDFSDGQILTAAKLDDVNCGIHVFADSTARTNAYNGTGERTLVEGEFSYLADTNTTQYYDGSAWQSVSASKFGQIVNVSKVDTFTTQSTSFVDVTGLSATITPTSASSTVLVMVNVKFASNNNYSSLAILLRGATNVGGGTVVGNRTSGIIGNNSTGIGADSGTTIFIDTPATTSATTYKIQARVDSGNGTFYVNRTSDDGDTSIRPRMASTLTLIEILP